MSALYDPSLSNRQSVEHAVCRTRHSLEKGEWGQATRGRRKKTPALWARGVSDPLQRSCGVVFLFRTARARPPLGPRAPKLARQPRANPASTPRRSTLNLNMGLCWAFFGAPGGAFLAAQVADRPTDTFLEPPGPILVAILAPSMNIFQGVFLLSWGGVFSNVFASIFATRLLSISFSSRVGRKRATLLPTRKNQWFLRLFRCSRPRRTRKTEGNRGQQPTTN